MIEYKKPSKKGKEQGVIATGQNFKQIEGSE
jgi:hypothetical protein